MSDGVGGAESLFTRFRRRKFIQWTATYLAGAWLIYQVVSLVGQNFAWPPVVLRVFTVLVGVGFVAACILAWYHGERGEQRVTGMELAMFGALAVLAGVGVTLVRRPLAEPVAGAAQPVNVARFALSFPDDQRVTDGIGVSLAWSPDGTRIIYVGPSEGAPRQLWQRSLNDLVPRPISGSEAPCLPRQSTTCGAQAPVVSPDGLSVAFFANGAIKTLALSGGPAFTVVEGLIGSGFGGIDWAPDGMLYYTAEGDLQRVPASGGTPETIAAKQTGTAGYWRVDALPDGGAIVMKRTGGSTQDDGEIAAISEDGEVRTLFPGTLARYSRSGHLVYTTLDLVLMAVPFDARRLEVTGPPVVLLEGVGLNIYGTAQFALSETGALAYLTAKDSPLRELVRVAANGEMEAIDPGWRANLESFTLSPDQTRLAVSITPDFVPGSLVRTDVWVKQLDRGPLSKLTFEGGGRTAWTPDGRSLSFLSDRAGASLSDVWITPADGTGTAKLLLDHDRNIYGFTWSADGAWLVGYAGDPGARDLFAWRPSSDSPPMPLLATHFDEDSPALSPDGRWLAYVSNESGRPEVYVRPFPDVDAGKWLISEGSGREPVWGQSGRQLFYRDGASQMVAVEVTGTPTFQVGASRILFSTTDYVAGTTAPAYAVTRDEQHFIMMRMVADSTRQDLILVQNFFEEIRARVGK